MPLELSSNRPFSHLSRVCRYFRPSDYAYGAAFTAGLPAGLVVMEKISPTYTVGTGAFAPAMRLSGFLGLGAGCLFMYQRSVRKFNYPRSFSMQFSNNRTNRTISWSYGKLSRNRYGYEGNGIQSQTRRAIIW